MVDGGVMPSEPTANPFTAIAMIAEKISDVIKADYQETSSEYDNTKTDL